MNLDDHNYNFESKVGEYWSNQQANVKMSEIDNAFTNNVDKASNQESLVLIEKGQPSSRKSNRMRRGSRTIREDHGHKCGSSIPSCPTTVRCTSVE